MAFNLIDFLKNLQDPQRRTEANRRGEELGKVISSAGGQVKKEAKNFLRGFFTPVDMTKPGFKLEPGVAGIGQSFQGLPPVGVAIGAVARTPKAAKAVGQGIRGIPKLIQPLAKEARKYKSAEEFIKRNIKKDYVGSVKETKLGTKGSDVFKLTSEARKKSLDITNREIEIAGKDQSIFNTNKGKSIEQLKKEIADDVKIAEDKGWSYPRSIQVKEEIIRLKQQLTNFYNQATKEARKYKSAIDLTKARSTKQFGFQGRGLKEITTELPLEDIPKRSVTTPEYRDYDVNLKAGRKVTKPIIATVKDINDPNSPIEIVDGWHRWRQAVANKDKTIPVKYIFQSLTQATKGVQQVGKSPLQNILDTPPTSQPPTPPGGDTDPILKMIQALKEAKPIRKAQEALYSQARAQRVAKVAAVGQRVPGEQGYFAQLGQLKGKLPKAEFEGIRNKLTPQDIDSVFNEVEQIPYFSPFEKVTAKTGLAKLLGKEGGVVPNKSELALLNEVFPPEFIKAAMGNKTLMQKILGGVGQVLAVPRSLMAGGFDMSYGLRQGVFSGYRHPKQWVSAFKEQFKYFGSDKAIQKLNNDIKAHPNYKIAREANLAFTEARAGGLKPSEEQFQSALAENIPVIGQFVRASGRAYTGFANKYRFDIFNDLVTQAKKTGDFDEPNFLKSAGELVNTLTGRGSLGPLERAAGTLSTTLFSPRLLASRLQLMNPQFYMKLQPLARRRAIESLVAYLAGTTTILGAAKVAGADVSTDITSADFAKIKVGNTRIDIMGGQQQPIVLLGRLLNNKVTSSTTGRVLTLGEGYKPLTRFDMIQRFFESKEAPVVSFFASLIKGQNNLGEPFDLPAETINRLVPMFISDLVELYKDGGLSSIPLGIPAFFGAGAQTYGKTELVSGRNQLGEPTSQIRPIQGLGESLSEILFGRQPLESSRTSNVEAFYDQLLKLPPEEAATQFDEISRTNPDLSKKILKVVKERRRGITIEDKVLKGKGVASGDRAKAIVKELNDLDNNEEKAALWDHYRQTGVMTTEVLRQVMTVLKNNPQFQGATP